VIHSASGIVLRTDTSSGWQRQREERRAPTRFSRDPAAEAAEALDASGGPPQASPAKQTVFSLKAASVRLAARSFFMMVRMWTFTVLSHKFSS
jgi:hypothetical protein